MKRGVCDSAREVVIKVYSERKDHQEAVHQLNWLNLYLTNLRKIQLGQTIHRHLHVIIHLCIFCTQEFMLFFLNIRLSGSMPNC